MTTAIALLAALAIGAASGTVELSVHEPSGIARSNWPVTSGIPFASGALRDPEKTAIFTAEGAELPLQTEVLVRWPDGSIRWLLLDFQVNLAADEKKELALRFGEGVRRRSVDAPLRVTSSLERTEIRTGPALLRFSPKAFRLLDDVWLDANGNGAFETGERLTASTDAGITLQTPDGRRFGAEQAAAKITVERSGPIRACLRFEGTHAGRGGAMFSYIARVHAYRGQPNVRIAYTFVNDHQDALLAPVDSLVMRFCLGQQATGPVLIDGRQLDRGCIFQVDESHYELDGKPSGSRAAGWAAVGDGRAGMAVGLREFWQNWPKSIEAAGNSVAVGICPAFSAGRYDGKPLLEENKLYYQLRNGCHTFKVGMARTHDIWATFFTGRARQEQLAAFFGACEKPLLATCRPAYVSATSALGIFPPADPGRYAGYDAWLDRALAAQLSRREKEREYGMLNYGDWYGERTVNWGNLEYDLAHGLLVQYVRTGDRRYFDRAEQAARHHTDVDVVHAVNPLLKNPYGAPPSVGDVWLHSCNHTGGYYDTDRLPVERTYQMGHSTNFGHVWLAGDLEYYYLSGDRRVWDVAQQVADAMASHCPTSNGTHIRNLGWPMILLLAAHEATGEAKYLKAAGQEWATLRDTIDWQKGWVVRLAGDHCLHPAGSTRQERETVYRDQRCHGNVPFMEGLTLCGLARYHRATGDPEVLRAITVGIDQMIRECWQEDVKTFRYTACPLSAKTPYVLFVLSAEAMAYEAAQTHNAEHLRILREGFRAAIPEGDGSDFGKNLAQMIHFAPYALGALDD